VQTLLTSDPHEISMAYWVWLVRNAGGVDVILDGDNGAQERKFVGGSQRLSDGLAARLGRRVVLDAPVRRIDAEAAPGAVVVTTRHGAAFAARFVIVAVPPALAGRIEHAPPLPPLRAQLCARMPMGTIIKTITYYATPWWRTTGYSGSVLDPGGPVVYSYDDTKPDGSAPAIMGFVSASHARRLGAMSVEQRAGLVSAQYARVLQNDEGLNVVKYVELDWTAEEFSGGCYMGVMTPGVLTAYGPALREPIGRMHFAGTETATRWAGYMDGAVQAGERAAYEVVLRLVREEGRGDGARAGAKDARFSFEYPSDGLVHLPPPPPEVEPEADPEIRLRPKRWDQRVSPYLPGPRTALVLTAALTLGAAAAVGHWRGIALADVRASLAAVTGVATAAVGAAAKAVAAAWAWLAPSVRGAHVDL
jgi:hypothetical protein